jgi:hypothetical protein
MTAEAFGSLLALPDTLTRTMGDLEMENCETA